MLTVQQATESILASVAALPAERRSLLDALGYVLAEDVLADIDMPPFDNSAVDGYAVIAADTAFASPDSPVILRELEEVHAGYAPTKTVTSGSCIRTMTGAPIPSGADAMVMIEDSRRDEGGRMKGDGRRTSDLATPPPSVCISSPARLGDHIRTRGEGVRAGCRVLVSGTLIAPPEVAMLAASGRSYVMCIRRPMVAVISTGDELVDISKQPGPGQIRDSNRYAMAAMVSEAGAVLHSLQHIRDDESVTESVFRRFTAIEGAAAPDAIVTSGGVSVGDHDYVRPVLERLGILDFWRV